MFLTDLADKLRAYKGADGTRLEVIETAGWKSRTYDSNGMAGNVGVLWHHTATANFSSSNTPTLGLVTNGRSDLAGPLCNILFGRGGEVVIVAAGQANHAGRGIIEGVGYENAGNYYLIGIEMESAGTWDDWTPEQRALAPHLGAALDLAYSGGGDYFQLGHKEYSYDGKIDPAYWDMDKFRGEINTLLSGGTVTAAPVPQKKIEQPAHVEKAQPAWIVEKGNTLSSIARYFFGNAKSETVANIAKANKISVSAPLRVGQKIVIPGPLAWDIEPGDTWQKVADYYDFDVNYLKLLNAGVVFAPGNQLTIY